MSKVQNDQLNSLLAWRDDETIRRLLESDQTGSLAPRLTVYKNPASGVCATKRSFGSNIGLTKRMCLSAAKGVASPASSVGSAVNGGRVTTLSAARRYQASIVPAVTHESAGDGVAAQERLARLEQLDNLRRDLMLKDRETKVKDRETQVKDRETQVKDRETQVKDRETQVKDREEKVAQREEKVADRMHDFYQQEHDFISRRWNLVQSEHAGRACAASMNQQCNNAHSGQYQAAESTSSYPYCGNDGGYGYYNACNVGQYPNTSGTMQNLSTNSGEKYPNTSGTMQNLSTNYGEKYPNTSGTMQNLSTNYGEKYSNTLGTMQNLSTNHVEQSHMDSSAIGSSNCAAGYEHLSATPMACLDDAVIRLCDVPANDIITAVVL